MANDILDSEAISDLVVARGIFDGASHEYANKNGQTTWYRGSLWSYDLWGDVPAIYQRWIARRGLDFTVSTKIKLEMNREYTIIGYISRTRFTNGKESLTFEATSILADNITFSQIQNAIANHVGEKKAQRVMELLKDDTPIEMIINLHMGEDDRLSEFDKDELTMIRQAFMDESNVGRELVKAQLRPYFGTKTQFASRMYDVYGFEALDALQRNPWEMLLTIPYMTLVTCDNVASILGMTRNHPLRKQTIVTSSIQKYLKDTNDTFIESHMMETVYEMFLHDVMSEEEFFELLQNTDGIQSITRTTLGYHLTSYLLAEKSIHHYVTTAEDWDVSISEEWLSEREKYYNINLNSKQREAVFDSITHDLFILTGGPGVGKTTTLKFILDANQKAHGYRDEQVILMAPTGKAAQRMTESVNRKATTIHKALGIIPDLGFTNFEGTFHRLRDKQIKLFVVDESSMLDTVIAGSVFQMAKALNARVILIGDADQLPSIGAGQVLEDLLANDVDTMELVDVQRQSGDSKIITLAQMIRRGEFPDADWFDNTPDGEVFFQSATNPTIFPELISNGLAKNKNNPPTILTPYRNPGNTSGVDTFRYLNDIAQNVLNPGKKDFIDAGFKNSQGQTERGRKFKVGDRVMSTSNYDDQIVNGTLGTVERVVKNGENMMLTVRFDIDGQEAELFMPQFPVRLYSPDELNELELAYALTIHKSQGSEYDFVIIPLIRTAQMNGFLSNNLIYTAVTRAKRKLVLLGSIASFKQAVRNKKLKRHTALQYLFVGYDLSEE